MKRNKPGPKPKPANIVLSRRITIKCTEIQRIYWDNYLGPRWLRAQIEQQIKTKGGK